MPHDPILMEDTRAWLRKASSDLRGAELDLAASPPLIDDALFHCQQAVEKTFKAFLSWHDVPFRKTHSIEEVGESCLKLDATLASLIEKAAPLTEYAWAFRYPGEPEIPDVSEANEAFSLAKEVFLAICSRLPAEVGRL